jgi:hypothetical protein
VLVRGSPEVFGTLVGNFTGGVDMIMG